MFEKLPTLVMILLLFVWLTLRGMETPWKAPKRTRRAKFAIDLIALLQIMGLLAAFVSLFRELGVSGALLGAWVVFFIAVPAAFTARVVLEDLLYAFSTRQTPPKEFDAQELALFAAGLDAPPDPSQAGRPRKRLKLPPFNPNVPEIRISEFSTISAPLR